MGSAFADCGLLFIAEGPLQLVKGQAPEALGSRDFAKGFAALEGYGVTAVYCCREALAAYGLGADDLLIPAALVDAEEIRELLRRYDQVVVF